MNGRLPEVSPLVGLVDAYCRRVYPAVLAQHESASICSPLGIWLLLAACASAGEPAALEGALGCGAEAARALLAELLAEPPTALRAAAALWARQVDATDEFREWSAALPREVERGAIPTQAEADAWAGRHTDGMIERFPIEITGDTRLLLASALATRVSWVDPYELVPAHDVLADGPWAGKVERLLYRPWPGAGSMIASTRAAGTVAVHVAAAREDLVVVSVSADPERERGAVLEAAHEVAALLRDEAGAERCSLFDLPLGRGHSWEIGERETMSREPGGRFETIAGVTLPAWRADGQLDLLQSELFGASPALDALVELIGRHPLGDVFEAKQVATASYTRVGFEAAAVTAFGMEAGAMAPRERGLERTAELRFDHPHAALALAGSASQFELDEPHAGWFGLPLFTAWVAEPEEAEGEHETGAT